MENKETKIFIMAGKARSGKDQSALIIKDIYEKKDLKVLNIQYSSYIKDYAKKIVDWDGNDDTKPREFLQHLGTEIIRKQIDENFFVNKIIDDIKVYSYFFDVITISDARCKIEIDIPKEIFKNVIAIHIERPDFDNGLSIEQKKHLTEVDLNDYDKYDYKIVNDGNIEQLENKILNIIKEVENES